MKKKIIALLSLVLIVISNFTVFASFNFSPDESHLKWPTTSTRVTDTFGSYRDHGYHKGIDIGAVRAGVAGDRVSAIERGIVMFSGAKSYANVVVVNHASNLNGFSNGYLQSVYTHGSNLQVSTGNTVYRGQKLCDMDGTFGYRVHLHFEIREIDSYTQPYVWSGGVPINPLVFYSGFLPYSEIAGDRMNHFAEINKINDGKSDRYTHSYGIMKGDRLYTVEYLLSMSPKDLSNANITNEDIISLSKKLKSINYKSSIDLKKLVD